MNVEQGESRRGALHHFPRTCLRLVLEIFTGALTLMVIVAIEAVAGVGLHWLVATSHNAALTLFVDVLEWVVLCADGACFVAMLFFSVLTFIKEVR